MKIKITSILLIIFLIGLVSTGLVSGQTITSGVSAGDVFDYDYKIIWTSTDPAASAPSGYVDLNNTQTFRIKVDRISGSDLTLQVTYIFKNGSHTSQTGQVSINQERVEVSFGFFIIRANVSLGELIYPAGTGKATMNNTTSRTYTSGQRETNHFITQSGSAQNSQEINIYYDKIRGVAVEYTNGISETIDTHSATTKEILTLTNPDQLTIPEFPQTITLIAVILAATLMIAVIKKKNC